MYASHSRRVSVRGRDSRGITELIHVTRCYESIQFADYRCHILSDKLRLARLARPPAVSVGSPEFYPLVATTMSEPEPTATTTAAPPEPEVAASVPIPDTPAAENAPAEKDEEAQNALTRKFTEDEWKAVKELRVRLPHIFAEAYAQKEDKTAPITLWGVSIDPASAKDARVSVILAKFVRARNLNVDDAEKMLIATLKWRDEFNVNEVVNEQFDEKIFGSLGRISGKDKEGCPVVYNLYGANKDLNAVFGDVDRFLRWRVAFMEKSIELLDFEDIDQMVQVHDYEGVSMMSRTTNQKAAASRASALFQDYYPEFLSRKFFVNVPSVMAWVFWLFKPFLSAKTMEKFSMVGPGPKTIGAVLLPIIDAQELPKRYGGEADDLA